MEPRAEISVIRGRQIMASGSLESARIMGNVI